MLNAWNVDETLRKPEFNALSPERRQLMAELMHKLQGKSSMESIYLITDYMKRMPKDKELSRDEQDSMIGAFLDALPNAERARFQSVINLIKGMQRG